MNVEDTVAKEKDTKELPTEPGAAKPPPKPEAGATLANQEPSSVTQTFPQRLMEMLDMEVAPAALWWTEDGKAFAIDLSKFEDVLHHHFQATKYASFTRKLNKWCVSLCTTSNLFCDCLPGCAYLLLK